MVSETIEAQNPMNAKRSSHQKMGCLGGSFKASERKLYYWTLALILAAQTIMHTVANQG